MNQGLSTGSSPASPAPASDDLGVQLLEVAASHTLRSQSLRAMLEHLRSTLGCSLGRAWRHGSTDPAAVAGAQGDVSSHAPPPLPDGETFRWLPGSIPRAQLSTDQWLVELVWPEAHDPGDHHLSEVARAFRVWDRLTLPAEALERAEQSVVNLAESEERLQLALAAANVGLWDWDVTSGAYNFNETYLSMLGFEPDELLGSLDTFFDLVHPDDREDVVALFEAHRRSAERPLRVEVRLRCKDGGYRSILSLGESMTRTPEGHTTRMLGVHVDIESQRRAREAALAANRAKSAFLTNVSHEIRTPMTSIMGYLDILEEDDRETVISDAGKRTVDTMRRNAKHLLGLIDNILDMAKIEAGQLHVEKHEMNLRALVEQVGKDHRGRAAAKGIELHVRWGASVPETIQSDPTRLHQVLVHLVDNALKFTAEGAVEISTAHDDGSLTMMVRDTGVGMSLEQLERARAFTPFDPADTSTTRRFDGAGLGLALSASIASGLGGRLSIDAVEAQGCTATLTLPLGA